MGLRLKFNLVVVPLVAGVTAFVVWADYRHELAGIMASHAQHAGLVGASPPPGPIDPATAPEVVAWSSLRTHVIAATALLVLLAAGINLTLQVLVLRPLARLRARLVQMTQGHWRGSVESAAEDELGRFVRDFQVLGLQIDATVGRALHADRLSAVALIARELTVRLEPELRRVARIAVALSEGADPRAQDAGRKLARSAAAMFAAVRGLDRVFPRGAARSGLRQTPRDGLDGLEPLSKPGDRVAVAGELAIGEEPHVEV